MIYFALAGSLVLNACFALALLKISLSGFSTLAESHERTTRYTEGLVDRLMANDYTTYQDRQLAMQANYSQARRPPTTDEVESLLTAGPDRGGFGSRLGLAIVPPDPEADYEAADLAERDEL